MKVRLALTAPLAYEKREGFCQSKVISSLTSFKGQAPKHTTVNWSIANSMGFEYLPGWFLVAWPLNESEAGVDSTISLIKARRFLSKQGDLQSHFIQRPGS